MARRTTSFTLNWLLLARLDFALLLYWEKLVHPSPSCRSDFSFMLPPPCFVSFFRLSSLSPVFIFHTQVSSSFLPFSEPFPALLHHFWKKETRTVRNIQDTGETWIYTVA